MKGSTTISLNHHGVELELDVGFIYTPGRPAYTPRGEYGPIDPPDPPEVDFTEVEITSSTVTSEILEHITDELHDAFWEQWDESALPQEDI